MKQAPLQLIKYWVDDIEVHSNRSFDPQKAADLNFDALKVDVEVDSVPDSSDPKSDSLPWVIKLSIQQDMEDGFNIPYAFSLNIAGLVFVHPKFPEDKIENAVQVNGPSMLFGAAREILRAATGRGPFPAVLIPSTTFIDRTVPREVVEAPSKTASPVRRKTVARKKAAGKERLRNQGDARRPSEKK